MKEVKIAEELAFYGAYHSNFENQVIHIIFVPMIMWSAFVMVGLVTHRFVPFLAWLAYAGFYLYLDPVMGSLATAFYFIIWYLADVLITAPTKKKGAKAVPSMTRASAFGIAVVLHLISWFLQVSVGHAIYEGRKPALLDSLSQAFSLAPLFVVYEFVWMLVPGFQADLKHDVATRIATIHQQWAAQAK